jgi:hypothetical protein
VLTNRTNGSADEAEIQKLVVSVYSFLASHYFTATNFAESEILNRVKSIIILKLPGS